MNERTTQIAEKHNIILIIITAACIGEVIEGILMGWEFWVSPLVICGMIASWILHVTQYGKSTFRENFYIIFCMILTFYHGTRQTSFFDAVVIMALLMVMISLLERPDFLLYSLLEYYLIMIMQFVLAFKSGGMEFDILNISRIVLHAAVAFAVYKILRTTVGYSARDKALLERRDQEKESGKAEMEDFLVNISHELRTPVNVIGGISELILKKEPRDDVVSIRDAGLRLARQIEDIQDYSEIQRGDVHLEEDRYMIVSLVNNIITEYELLADKPELALVIDLDPAIPAMLRGDAGKLTKIVRHLLGNAVKFTRRGGIYLKLSGFRREYGFNLMIEITDTGIGMTNETIENISNGIYQVNKGRNRSTGGIGLGLPVVYGFTRKMNGFVTIDSERKRGTTVRVSIAQEIIDPAACLRVETKRFLNAAFYVRPEKYRDAAIRDFNNLMANDLAQGLRINLYSAPCLKELKKILERTEITHVFMGAEEYEGAPDYFDELAGSGITVAVSASPGFTVSSGSHVIIMPKPLYAYPVVRILNGDTSPVQSALSEEDQRLELDGIHALVVDDEPMNLVVASGLFRAYRMSIDTALSGREAIQKYTDENYDVIFMDHMMPEMDGVEAMKRLRDMAVQYGRSTRMIALTANAVSGAREMFMKEGFDGFISKPISIADFERTMRRLFSGSTSEAKGDRI